MTFTWTAGSGVLEYWLEIGTTAGNGDVYTASQGTALSRTVSTLPTTGGTLYVRLWSRFPAGWQPNAYTYTAAPMNVSGVWSGAFSTSLVSGMISFTIEQSGVNLSGSFSVSATSGSGAGT